MENKENSKLQTVRECPLNSPYVKYFTYKIQIQYCNSKI